MQYKFFHNMDLIQNSSPADTLRDYSSELIQTSLSSDLSTDIIETNTPPLNEQPHPLQVHNEIS